MSNPTSHNLEFEAIFNAAPDAMIIVDRSGTIAFVNQQTEALFGYEPEELIGQKIEILVPGRFGKAHVGMRDRYIDQPVARSMGANQDLWGLRKDGSEFPVEISLSPITNAGETWVCSAIRDVTDKRKLDEKHRESKEQLLNIFRNVPGTIFRCLCEETWPIIMISDEVQTLTGYPPEHFLGEEGAGFGSVILPEDHKGVEEGVMTAITNKTNYSIDYRVVHKDGTIKWVKERGLGTYGEDGKVLFLDGVITDITAQKDVLARLRKNQQELAHREAVLNEAQRIGKIGSWEFDMQTAKIEWSDQVYAIHNFDKDDERDWVDESIMCYAEADRQIITDAFQNCINNGVPYDLELRFKPKDRDWLWVRTVGRPYYDDDGNLNSIIGSIVDVTEYKEAGEALMKAKNEAEAANRAKSSFLANMSHELRTPMNAIIGYSEMLIEDAEDDGNDEMVPDLERIRNAGKHLLELINDVLDLSKVEAGKMDVVLDVIEVQELIRDVEETITGLISNNGNRFEVSVGEGVGSMTTDYVKLKQSLLNILSNAAKFTSDGTVGLHVVAENDDLVFRISDTGIGIAQEKIESLFDEFTQADDTTTREYGGTGLGLAITKRFCEMLQGSIHVESVLGEGSVFIIRLPKTPEVEETPADTNDISPVDGSSDQRPVLVIEDDPNAANLIERILNREGYRVVKARNGQEGVEKAREVDPFVITLDVMMPEKDGWTVLRELKDDDEVSNIPVIIISVLDNLDLGYALGADAYMTKPVRKDVLIETIERCIPENNKDRGPVLIVDDEEDARQLLHRLLTNKGWHTELAANGQEALNAVYANKPSLILLDLMMPVMDGFTFMKELRRFDPEGEIPVVVVTARDLSLKEVQELNQSVDQIVYKGAYDMNELMEQVKQLVNKIKMEN